jgi:hypothetical protein
VQVPTAWGFEVRGLALQLGQHKHQAWGSDD